MQNNPTDGTIEPFITLELSLRYRMLCHYLCKPKFIQRRKAVPRHVDLSELDILKSTKTVTQYYIYPTIISDIIFA